MNIWDIIEDIVDVVMMLLYDKKTDSKKVDKPKPDRFFETDKKQEDIVYLNGVPIDSKGNPLKGYKKK